MSIKEQIRCVVLVGGFCLIGFLCSVCQKPKTLFKVKCLEETGLVSEFDAVTLNINSTSNLIIVSVYDVDGHERFCRNFQASQERAEK